MGKKSRNRCFICQTVFKQKMGELRCDQCGSNSVSRLRKVSESKQEQIEVAREVELSFDQTKIQGSITSNTINGKKRKHTVAQLEKKKLKVEDPKHFIRNSTVTVSTSNTEFTKLETLDQHQNMEKKLKKGESASAARRAGATAMHLLSDRVTVIESCGIIFDTAILDIKKKSCVAVDCEGVKLSRTGALTLLQVATEENYYLFDILKIGGAAFSVSGGLKDVLENASLEKLMFDCRVDSDALFHQFGVSLDGVVDLQLLSVAVTRMQGHTVDWLPGLTRTCQKWMGKKVASTMFSLNESIRSMYAADAEEGASELWARRPLEMDVVRYAAADVAIQIPLRAAVFEKLEAEFDCDAHEEIMVKVRAASQLRLKEFKDLEVAHVQEKDPNKCVAPII